MLKIPLEPEKFYHIYNHAVSKENIFGNDGNYLFFLQKYMQYISPIADTFAYCLMPNHFHFALQIKTYKELSEFFYTKLKNKLNLNDLQKLKEIIRLISLQFGHFFNSYAQAFNKQNNRKGSLFEKNFERKLIDSDEYFRSIIHYIHYNPVHHRFVEDLRDWKHSSFESFFSEKATRLKREEVISWYGDKNDFFLFHKKEIDEKMSLELEFI